MDRQKIKCLMSFIHLVLIAAINAQQPGGEMFELAKMKSGVKIAAFQVPIPQEETATILTV